MLNFNTSCGFVLLALSDMALSLTTKALLINRRKLTQKLTISTYTPRFSQAVFGSSKLVAFAFCFIISA